MGRGQILILANLKLLGLLNTLYVRVTVQSHDNNCDSNQPSNEIDLDMGTSDFFSFAPKLIILDLMSKKKIAIDLQGEL